MQHILASGAQNGSCIVWDLRQKKAWCELRDPQQGTVADIAWNPDQGLHLVTGDVCCAMLYCVFVLQA